MTPLEMLEGWLEDLARLAKKREQRQYRIHREAARLVDVIQDARFSAQHWTNNEDQNRG